MCIRDRRDAVVTVFQKGNPPTLLGKRTTDRNGITTAISVSAPDVNLSETNAPGVPFALVDIRVDHPNFYTVLINDSQVFAGQTSLVNLAMIPLAENEVYNNMLEEFTTTPQNL